MCKINTSSIPTSGIEAKKEKRKWPRNNGNNFEIFKSYWENKDKRIEEGFKKGIYQIDDNDLLYVELDLMEAPNGEPKTRTVKVYNMARHSCFDVITQTFFPRCGNEVHINYDLKTEATLGGTPVKSKHFGNLIYLPEYDANRINIISSQAMKGIEANFPDRKDFILPGNRVIDKDTKNIIGCEGFLFK